MYPMILTTTWNKEANINSDTIKCALSNTAYTYVATHKYFDVAPFSTAWTELSTANGYTAGGVTLSSPATTSAQTTSWTAGTATWTATSSGISATSAVVYDSTPASNKPVISYVLFGGTFTASAGGTFTITWNASGIISVVVA